VDEDCESNKNERKILNQTANKTLLRVISIRMGMKQNKPKRSNGKTSN